MFPLFSFKEEKDRFISSPFSHTYMASLLTTGDSSWLKLVTPSASEALFVTIS
jgi:hypothetical protein